MKKNSKMKLYARHGDVYIWKIEDDSIAKDVETTEKKDKQILAYGEVSGHMHTMSGEMLVQENYKENGNVYFELLTEGSLTHQEHETIKFTPGKYISVVQEEHDPVERYRKVRD